MLLISGSTLKEVKPMPSGQVWLKPTRAPSLAGLKSHVAPVSVAVDLDLDLGNWALEWTLEWAWWPEAHPSPLGLQPPPTASPYFASVSGCRLFKFSFLHQF